MTRYIEEFVSNRENMILFNSLGQRRYLSAIAHADMVIGNSSSGLLEAPYLGVPTVNIGDRQKGRLRASSVIDCESDEASIIAAMRKALDSDFRKSIRNMHLPYGDGHTTERIHTIISDFLTNDQIDLKKKFYDIQF